MRTRFHPGEYLQDELDARGWSTRDCAERMGGDVDVDHLALDILIACASAPDGHAGTRVRINDRIAFALERALGTSAETWMNLDRAYHSPAAS